MKYLMLGCLLGISFSASAWNDGGYGIAYDKGAVRRGDGGGNTTAHARSRRQ